MRRGARLALYGGIVITVVGLSLLHANSIAENRYSYFSSGDRVFWSIVYVGTLLMVAYGLGLPELPRSAGRALFTSTIAAASGALLLSVVQLMIGEAILPRFVVFGTAILLVPWYLFCAALALGARQRDAVRDRVLIVASPEDVAPLRHDLRRAPERAASIAAVVLPADARGEECKPPSDGPLFAKAMELNATVVVLDRAAEADGPTVNQAAELHSRGFRVRSYAQFTDEWLGKVPLADLGRASLLFDVGEVHRTRYGRVKRLMDIVVGLIGMVVLVVMIPFVALGDLVANRGPLFFGQERVGKQGTQFRILKFRTMVADPAPSGDATLASDPRVTPFGRILRKTHLDEIPQAWNLVRGDLSVVGPRPEQPRYVEEYSLNVPFYELRHMVRPGLTGWAQVKYPYGANEEDAREKLQYEFWYLRHQTLGVDLRVIGRTLRSVLGGEGR